MGWEPGVVKFGDGYYEFPKDTFDSQEYSRIQADYLLQHQEVRALAAVFISRMARKPLQNVNVLKEAGLFFTRSTDDLESDLQQQLKRTGKLGFEPDIMKKNESTPIRRRPRHESSPCPCPSDKTFSVVSIYSDFVTVSTSITTLPSVDIQEISTPTLEEAMRSLVIRAMKTGLNTLYAAREREIVYDEAYLCLISSIQKAVEAKWNPIIDDIKCIIEAIIDDVRVVAVERHRLKMIMTNKVPIKINRLRNNYKEESPPPSRNEVMETVIQRQGTYNRYPKDAFGVYVSTWDPMLDRSVTKEPDRPVDT